MWVNGHSRELDNGVTMASQRPHTLARPACKTDDQHTKRTRISLCASKAWLQLLYIRGNLLLLLLCRGARCSTSLFRWRTVPQIEKERTIYCEFIIRGSRTESICVRLLLRFPTRTPFESATVKMPPHCLDTLNHSTTVLCESCCLFYIDSFLKEAVAQVNGWDGKSKSNNRSQKQLQF